MKKYLRSFRPVIFLFFIIFALFSLSSSYTQELDELEVGGEDDLESVLEEGPQKEKKKAQTKSNSEDVSLSEREAKDDLESLKEDLGDIILEDPLEDAVKTKVSPAKSQKKGVVRGNHYHKKTTQFMYMISGSLIYWYKKVNSKKKVKALRISKGELVKTPPYEIHALTFDEKNEFIVLSKGLRGGKDYEKDTFRVPPINK